MNSKPCDFQKLKLVALDSGPPLLMLLRVLQHLVERLLVFLDRFIWP